MFSVYTVDGIIQRFQICYLILDVLEVVLMFHRVNRSSQSLQVIDMSFNSLKLMFVVRNIIHRTSQPLEFNDISVELLVSMTMLDIKDGSVEVLQLPNLPLNIRETMLVVDIEDRPSQGLQVGQFGLDFFKSVGIINVVLRPHQSPQVIDMFVELSEVVFEINIIARTLQRLQIIDVRILLGVIMSSVRTNVAPRLNAGRVRTRFTGFDLCEAMLDKS